MDMGMGMGMNDCMNDPLRSQPVLEKGEEVHVYNAYI
jgi:hypothetical protein